MPDAEVMVMRAIECARCHQIGRLELGERGSAGLDELTATGGLVCRGCVTAYEEWIIRQRGIVGYDVARDRFADECD